MAEKENQFSKIKRDFEILRSLVEIATLLDKRSVLDSIKTPDIVDFVKQASNAFCTNTFYYWCIGGSAYIKDDGHKDFSLSLPRYDKNYKNFELADTTPSTVAPFSYATHVEDKTEAKSEGWGVPIPSEDSTSGWKPSSFEV